MLLFTSIPPKFSRKDRSGNEIGHEYLAACVTSWRDNGFEPVSINRPDEVDTVAALGLVEVRPASMTDAAWPDRFGPPLGDVFDALPDEQVAFTNADIFILRSDLSDFLRHRSDGSMVTARRSDVPHLGARKCTTFDRGFDFFSFHRAQIPEVIGDPDIRRFQLGAPWWDYVFPMACKKWTPMIGLREPIVVHQEHADRWNVEIWKDLGLQAGRIMAKIHPDDFGPIMNNLASFEHPQRAISYKFRSLLFDDMQAVAVPTRPCRHFPQLPVTRTKRLRAVLQRIARALRARGSWKDSRIRKVTHGARNVLRRARRRSRAP